MNCKHNVNEILGDLWDVWSNKPIPDKSEIFSYTPDDEDFVANSEQKNIEKWLLGKSYEQLVDSEEIEALMPFEYLGSQASLYYLGGYCLDVLRQHDTDKDYGFPYIACAFYMASSKLINDILKARPSPEELNFLTDFFHLVFEIRKGIDYGFDDEVLKSLNDNLDFLKNYTAGYKRGQ